MAVTELTGNMTDSEKDAAQNANNNYLAQFALGWIHADEIWTYASADSPTFAFTVNGDVTSKYCVGMRLKLTQTTVKYFIITKISYSSPNTTITIFGGTDYTLANAAISNNYFSAAKAPIGFPLNIDKWTYSASISDFTQNNPAANTVYNAGSIAVPIGAWTIKYKAAMGANRSDPNWVTAYCNVGSSSSYISQSSGSYSIISCASITNLRASVYGEFNLETTNKQMYYLNIGTDSSSSSSITLANIKLKCICNYV